MENITWGSTYNYKPSFFVKTMTNGPEKPVKTDELISRPESKGARDRGASMSRVSLKKMPVSHVYGQIPQNGLTLGSYPQQWGSHYTLFFKICLIDALYCFIR